MVNCLWIGYCHCCSLCHQPAHMQPFGSPTLNPNKYGVESNRHGDAFGRIIVDIGAICTIHPISIWSNPTNNLSKRHVNILAIDTYGVALMCVLMWCQLKQPMPTANVEFCHNCYMSILPTLVPHRAVDKDVQFVEQIVEPLPGHFYDSPELPCGRGNSQV